ncbi:MAG: hypothetical protein OM95_03535 [Bdellovibrio sp. ArHS]|uniref:Ig-like domain-containing protein n=1 Tax=Bdellovibrio sp. ArHS TaxID=1569284 RepID=UPI0005827FA7|nr:Ig-like domain-containing protein [Bdellovibrio sp. ArHS]KHD89448.1 MAG: hypothetical protein OM95_03535 [Bdellovibrio sp. ArHS]
MGILLKTVAALPLVGCSLDATLVSSESLNKLPISWTSEPVINIQNPNTVTVDGSCKEGLESFEILNPPPKKTVQCKDGKWQVEVSIDPMTPDGTIEVITDLEHPKTGDRVVIPVTKDTQAPVIDNVVVAGGKAKINITEPTVQIISSATDIHEVLFSEGAGCGGTGPWKSFQSLSSFALSDVTDGNKNLSVLIRDRAGNTSNCVNKSVLLDRTAPAPTITSLVSAKTNASPIAVTVDFGEPIQELLASDFSVENGVVGGLVDLGAGKYNVSITPVLKGSVSIKVDAGKVLDEAGNFNVSGNQLFREYDSEKPSVTITTDAGDKTNGMFDVTIKFSKKVTGFVSADVHVANGTRLFLSGSDDEYRFTINPISSGIPVKVYYAEDQAQDEFSNYNTASNWLTVDYLAGSVSATLETEVTGTHVAGAFPVSLKMSRTTDIVKEDLEVTNATIEMWTPSLDKKEITFNVVPSAVGNVQLQLSSGKAQDDYGNFNSDSNILSVVFDNVPPGDPQNMSVTPTSPAKGNPVVSGNAEALANFKVYSNAICTAELTSGVVDSSGDFSKGTIVPANTTTHLYVQIVDAAGNKSNCVYAGAFTEDSTPPKLSIFSKSSGEQDDDLNSRLVIEGGCSEEGRTITFVGSYVQPVAPVQCQGGRWEAQFIYSGYLPLKVQLQDAAGNAAEVTWTYDSRSIAKMGDGIWGHAFLRPDGYVDIWEDPGSGSSFAYLDPALKNPSTQVIRVYGAKKCGAAITETNAIIRWQADGSQGQDDSVYRCEVAPSGGALSASKIFNNATSFAALQLGGSVLTWGLIDTGGDHLHATFGVKGGTVTSGVKAIYSGEEAFAAIKTDGSVVTWGAPTRGGNHTHATYGAKGGSLSSGVVKIFSNKLGGFAALKSDGSVVTWGDLWSGGDHTNATHGTKGGALTGGVKQIVATYAAFAALKSDGSVVTWGTASYGGDHTDVVHGYGANGGTLDSGVIKIFANKAGAFAALKADGSVVTWGINSLGGNHTHPTFFGAKGGVLTSGVVHIYENSELDGSDNVGNGAFAALKSDGSVVTWGSDSAGGDHLKSGYANKGGTLTSGVVKLFPNGDGAFAALKEDGSVVTWGKPATGGDHTSVTYGARGGSLTSGVIDIATSKRGFAALKSDGSVVTWGQVEDYTQGNSPGLASGVQKIYSTDSGFVAVKGASQYHFWGWSGPGY